MACPLVVQQCNSSTWLDSVGLEEVSGLTLPPAELVIDPTILACQSPLVYLGACKSGDEDN